MIALKTDNKNVKDIEKETGLSHETVRVRLADLEKMDLIRQVPGSDRRQKIFSLTSHGFLKLNELDEGLKAESFLWLLHMFLTGGMLAALFLDNRLPDDELNNIKAAISSKFIPFTNKPSKERYLFSWDEIPGNDNQRLTEYLEQKFVIYWAKTAKIEKINHDNTIRVNTEKNSLSLILNNEKTKLNLKIDDGRTYEFIVNQENGKLNIYKSFHESIFEGICLISEIYRRNNLLPPYQPHRFNLNQLKSDAGEIIIYIATRAAWDNNPDHLKLLQFLPQWYFEFIKLNPMDADYILSNISLKTKLDECFSASQNLTLEEYKKISKSIEIFKNMQNLSNK